MPGPLSRRKGLRRMAGLGSLLAGTSALAPLGLFSGCATSPDPRRPLPPGPPLARWQPPEPFLVDELPRLMQRRQVPAVAMACVHPDEPLWQHHAGRPQAGSERLITPDSVFEAASLSKPVLAWLALRLADEGLLDPDQPLTACLRPPWLAGHEPWLDRITTRIVLSHTTGLPNWRAHPLTERLTPAFNPGSQISYSGEAFFWLQLVLEHLTQASLDTLARRYLFEPAGMASSSFAWDDRLAERSVYGHAAPEDGPLTPLPRQGFRTRWATAAPLARQWNKPLAQWRWTDAERAYATLAAPEPGNPTLPDEIVGWPGDLMANGAASLRCTAADYARFLQWMMATPHLSPARQALLTTAQFEIRPGLTAKTLGWNLEHLPRHGTPPVLYHGGNNANQFRAFALAQPATGRALVVLTNGGGGGPLCQRLAQAATGLELLAWGSPG